jgi:Tfp pilus assembly protein PilO
VKAFFQTKKGVIVAGVVGVAAVIAAGWMLVVSPERKKADDLAAQVTASQAELAQKRAELARPSAAVRVKADDLFRLSKALPGQVDAAGVLLDVDRVANGHGLEVWAVTPVAPVPTVDVLQAPFDVVLEGRFDDVSSFLRDMRKLVAIKGGRLAVQGRVYTVDQVKLQEPTSGATFPIVRATFRVNAFSYAPVAPAPAGAPQTTTTPTATVAAGATP